MTDNGHATGEAPVGTHVGARLQDVLVATLALGLLTKQAHWNVHGPGFRDVHLHLDEISDELREQSDVIAERAAAIGFAPDGRAATIVATSPIESLPAGPLTTAEVLEGVSRRLQTAIEFARGHLEPLGEADAVSQDRVISLIALLEQQRWQLLSGTTA